MVFYTLIRTSGIVRNLLENNIHDQSDGRQNFIEKNVEQPIFQNFVIANIKITKHESNKDFYFRQIDNRKFQHSKYKFE